jgi:hypothetical protein
MSDDPRPLKQTLLENATTEQQQQFAKMLAEQCATADLQAKGHRCSFFIPSPTEYARMAKYNEPPNYDKCPKCGKGRLLVSIYRGNLGDSWTLVCSWGDRGCDFSEYVSDDL